MTAAQGPEGQGQQPADVFVVFGITGDLAKVMTFRSLYRLERRGLLDCPIVGVAVDDWTDDQLRDHARECIVGTGFEPALRDSLFMGCVSYNQRFFADGRISDERFRKAIIAASLEVRPLEATYKQFGWATAAGRPTDGRCAGPAPAPRGAAFPPRARRRAA